MPLSSGFRNHNGSSGARGSLPQASLNHSKRPRVAETKRPRAARNHTVVSNLTVASANSASQTGGPKLTRRHFLMGAAGLAGIGVVGASIAALSNRQQTAPIGTLTVSASQVETIESYTQVNPEDMVSQQGEYTLPFGSLIWACDDTYAACLIPTETSSPLVTGALLNLSTGKISTILPSAQGQKDGFEVFDIRASKQGVIWVEQNIFANQWRVYVASHANGNLGEVYLVDEGAQDTETPSLAAVGDSALWQVMPTADVVSTTKKTTTTIKRAGFSNGAATAIYSSPTRSACGLYAGTTSVVAAPHHPDSSRYYQVVSLDVRDGSVLDSITLPSGMKPTEVASGPFGLSFCFESIYNFGGGIANLGTYCPAGASERYDTASWFRFSRTPFAAPAWLGSSLLAVKSTTALCIINPALKSYTLLDAPSGSLSWGDYLATSGERNTLVSIAQINPSQSEESNKTCRVRIWKSVV